MPENQMPQPEGNQAPQPEEDQAPQQENAPPAPKKGSGGLITVIIIAALVIGGGFYWWQSTETNDNINSVVVTNKANTNATTNTSTNTESDIDTLFQGVVNQNNWNLTADYFADSVYFVIEGSECCGDITAIQAADQMSYMDGITFDFSQDQQLVKTIKTNLGVQGFSDETIGIASTKQVISYHVDSQNKVDRVYMSVSHELMDLE